MKKTQFIELVNTIKVTMVSFISISLFVLLATTVYLGINWASTSFDLSVDKTLNTWNMHDAEITYPYSFTDEEIQKINNLEYVEYAEGSISTEATFAFDGNNYQAKISMIPDKIDNIKKYEGNLPSKKGEILVDEIFANKQDISIGDKLVFIHDEEDDTYDLYNIINEDLDALQDKQTSNDGMRYLTTDVFVVTGIGTSPTGISHLKETYGVSSTTSIPNDCFLYASKESFDLKAFGGYQTLLVKGKDLDKYKTLSDEYVDAFNVLKDKLEDDLKPYISERNEKVIKAISNLKQEINDKIADGEKQIEDAEIEIRDGFKKIEDAEKQIDDGKIELIDAKKELEDGQKQIDDGFKEIKEGQKQLDQEKIKKQNVENAFNVLKALSNPYNNVYKQLRSSSPDLLATFDELSIISTFIDSALDGSASKQSYETAVINFNNAIAPLTKEQYLDNLNTYAESFLINPGGEYGETLKQLIISIISSTNDFLNNGNELINLSSNETKLFNLLHNQGTDTLFNDEIITNLNAQLNVMYPGTDITDNLLPYATYDTLADARYFSSYISSNPLIYSLSSSTIDSFNDIWNTFEENQEELNNGLKELIKGQEKIDDGWDQYYEGLEIIKEYEKDLEEGKQDLINGQKDVEEGKQKIEDNKDKIKDFDSKTADIKKYDIAVLGRKFNAGVAATCVPTDVMDKFKFTLALLFVIVGILVTYSALSRSVHDQTVLIGTKKALGLRRKDINIFFIMYAALATTIGSLLGTFIARFIAEPIVIAIIAKSYVLGDYVYYFSLKDSVIFYLFELITALVITIIACNKLLKQNAVKLLAGNEELTGKIRFYERTKLWKSLPLMTKTIINNCLNDSRRVFATLVGITGFSSIMVCAAVMFTSIGTSINYQFDYLTKFDSLVYFDSKVESASKDIEKVLNENNIPNVDVLYSTYTIKNDDETYINASIFVYDDSSFLNYFVLSNNGEPINTKGLCISKAYAIFRNINIGDSITYIDNKGNEHTLEVAGIFDNYITRVEMVMDADTYKREYGKDVENIAFIVDTKGISKELLFDKLKNIDGFKSINDYYQDSIDLLNALKSPIYGLVAIFFILAIVLAFLVLLNLLVMFVDEKKKELIVLMINGYSRKDAERYIYGDTIVLTIIGIICGTILGAVVGIETVKTFDSDIITLIRDVNIPSYVVCAILTSILSAITCKMALSKIKQFKLTEINKA